MLNFKRNGTPASAGVSQITMPSRYRSVLAGAAPGAGCADAPLAESSGAVPGRAATSTVRSGPAAGGCADTGAVNDVTDANATATAAFTNARGRKPAPRR